MRTKVRNDCEKNGVNEIECVQCLLRGIPSSAIMRLALTFTTVHHAPIAGNFVDVSI